MKQPSLFGPEQEPAAPSRTLSPEDAYVADLVEQIARDTLTLKDALVFPDRAFYEERIASYREEVKRIRGKQALIP